MQLKLSIMKKKFTAAYLLYAYGYCHQLLLTGKTFIAPEKATHFCCGVACHMSYRNKNNGHNMPRFYKVFFAGPPGLGSLHKPLYKILQ